MINALLKSLYFYEIVFTIFGVLLILESKKLKYILVILAFFGAIAWRSFSSSTSSRYFCLIIFAGTFFTAYGINAIIATKYKKQSGIIILPLIIALFCIHTPKVFSGFRNNYILDLQESLKRINIKNRENDICIFEKEYNRLNLQEAKRKIGLIPTDMGEKTIDIDSIYLKYSSLANSLFIVIPEKTNEERWSFSERNRFRKIERHITSYNHDRSVSIIRYFPPRPDINIESIFENAQLKAYVPEYDTFIYHEKGHLIWLIGGVVDEKTEIIYHAYTNIPVLLPAHRVQYGFDNLGFHINDKQFERDHIGHYRVFIRDISPAYPVSFFRAGFKRGDMFIWRTFWIRDKQN